MWSRWGEDGLNWMMARLAKKEKRKMGRVKGASEDLARHRSLGCWEKLESPMVARGVADVA